MRALQSHWLAVVVFVALTVVHTWSMATNPAVLSRNDNGDTQFNDWIIAWVVHQLPRNALQLLKGNISYPAKDSRDNLILLAGFTLTGL